MVSRWLLALCLVSPAFVSAQTIQLTAGQIEEALSGSGGGSGVVEQVLADALSEAGVAFEQGALLSSQTLQNVQLSTGCTTRATLESMTVEARLRDETGIAFRFDNLNEPADLALTLSVDLSGNGNVDQDYGARLFGDCSYYASDDFSVSLDGALDLSLDLSMQLNPTLIPDVGLQLEPSIQVTGAVDSYQLSVNVEETLLASLIEDELENEVDGVLSNENIQSLVGDLQQSLNQAVAEAMDDGPLLVTAETLNDDEMLDLYTRVSQDLSFPMTFEYFSDNSLDLLLAALGDDAALDRATALAACDASQLWFADMDYAPLYGESAEGVCERLDLRAPYSVDAYLDNACTNAVAFKSTSPTAFCEETLDLENLGNGANLLGQEPFWTLYPGTRYDIGLQSIKDKQQPYMTRRLYRSVETDEGQCQLEMRIYKPSIDAEGLQPLMVLHGGSWRHRGAGYPAQESQISHYTDAGFAVFAPFYRLADAEEGNVECQNASAEDILSDTEAALDWVQANAPAFGADDGKVVVAGQSAGAYLAASLAVKQSSQVDRALLFYPPTDFVNYLELYQADPEGMGDDGVDAVEGFTGRSIDELSPQDADVIAWSLPQLAQNQVSDVAPMFLIHGVSDAVVPSIQSVRLCNALSGDAESGNAVNDGGSPQDTEYRKIYACDDRGSQLHLIAEADHALDVCAFSGACPAGSLESQIMTGESIADAYRWLVDDSVVTTPQNGGNVDAGGVGSTGNQASTTSSGGGGAWGFGLLALLAVRRIRGD